MDNLSIHFRCFFLQRSFVSEKKKKIVVLKIAKFFLTPFFSPLPCKKATVLTIRPRLTRPMYLVTMVVSTTRDVIYKRSTSSTHLGTYTVEPYKQCNGYKSFGILSF